MRASRWKRAAAIALAAGILAGCGEERRAAEDRGEAAAELVWAPIQTEMKTVLRDIRIAQEQARSARGRYIAWGELERDFLARAVPDAYRVELSGVSATGYRAEVIHERSGLRCGLEEGTSGSRGPTCR